ncbi:PTS system mannose-specific EIIC component [Raoultella terrigena]|uniref:PTS system mannose-specific EIIC component n=1 Tax=Raoultella terrigena TaxID=577 RepID=A0A485BW91_RAOTE|nr:PTS system mannose-specific EIIC component [Raoultella terrigena]
MEITLLQIVLVFIVACIAGMESVLDEFQFHRPLVACTLIGAVLGDMKTGIIIGGTLEMIALGWMNIGAAVAPDAALASIISTVLVIAGHQSIGAGIALAIPLAAAGQVLTIIVRTITVAFQHAADKAADSGNLTAISWLHVSSLFLQAMRIAIPAVIVAISVGTSEVQGLLNAIPEVVTGGSEHRRWHDRSRWLRDGHQHDARRLSDAVLLPRLRYRCIHRLQPGCSGRDWYRNGHPLHPAEPEIQPRSGCASAGCW